ncbi:unnamed protein product [Paramecium pentaurelia]|uniref:Transmembrane protein n=1 Tax=Paramecium pentaurelia TaxID=43138 RepID=A0A8S1UKN7_9CILI|nr:unnamed protein product [Paramecium pentaurelia]
MNNSQRGVENRPNSQQNSQDISQQEIQINQISQNNNNTLNQLIQVLNNQTNLPIDQFKIVVDSVVIDKQFLLLTLNPKGKYFQTLRKLILLIVGFLTLQFYQLLYLFTQDQIIQGHDDNHSKLILRPQEHIKNKNSSRSHLYLEEQIDQLILVIAIRIIYIVISYIIVYGIKSLSLNYSNKNLLLFFLLLISGTYFIQGTQCNLYPNYGSLHFEDIGKINKTKIYLDNLIFFGCFFVQGMSSASIFYLLMEQVQFMLKKNQRLIFYNEFLLIIVEFIVVSSVLHMIFKEQYIFNLIIMWIPFSLITLFAYFTLQDSPLCILNRISHFEEISKQNQQNLKKQQIALNKIEILLTEFHQNMNSIYSANFPNRNYFTEEQISLLINKFQFKVSNKQESKCTINFIMFALSLLYFGHLFKLYAFVNQLQWTIETLALILSIFELLGYFIGNYCISELYNEHLLRKLLMTFGLINFLSSLPSFQSIHSQFQSQVEFFSILIVRLLFSLAIKAFLIQFSNYKLNFGFLILGLLLANINLLQIQLFQVVIATILLLAYHLSKRF